MNIFTTLMQGDTATWVDDPVTLADNRVADATGWVLKYALRGPVGLDLTAVAAGASWSTTLGSAASLALTPGTYAWAAFITKDAERITIGQGSALISINFATLPVEAAYDSRSVAKRALDACEAAMATFKATGGLVKKYEIAGRSMEYQSFEELQAAHSFWQAKVLAEETKAAIANGQGNPRNMYTRFRHPSQ